MSKSSGFAALTLCAMVAASAPAFAQEKFAVVDLDQAINATEQGKAAREELSRKKRSAEEQLQPMIDRGQALQKELQDKRFVLSEEALYAKQLDLLELENQVKTKKQELEGQLKVDYERLVGPLRNKLSTIVQQIGKEQGFTFVIERNTPGLLYSREALDITDVVIERFNTQG